MRDLNFTYIVAGLVFGYVMFIVTEQLTLSIILGIGVAFGGNAGCILKSKKESN